MSDPSDETETTVHTDEGVTPLAAVPRSVSFPDGTIALVAGDAVDALPKDLYIPPDALQVVLETFQGPLDLLLYLIRRQNLDILEIKVAQITAQYMQYIDLMNSLQLELAGEYLVMAAMLAEIKSRMLLPRPESDIEDEDDPRAELIRRLQEYERFKDAAEHVDQLPRVGRDVFPISVQKPELERPPVEVKVEMQELMLALAAALHRSDMFQRHAVQLEPLSVRERMTAVLDRVNAVAGTGEFISFANLLQAEEGRLGVIVTFLAIMELIRESLIEIVQQEQFAPIYVKAAG